MGEYLRAFVIGSSFYVFFLFFFFVSRFDPKKFHYSYKKYSFLAPVGLGIMNMIALWIAKTWNLTRRMKYFVMSILAPICVLVYVYMSKTYTYTRSEWITHIIGIFVVYSFVFNVILYELDSRV
jgi:heme/copper-type cytochrome/quinol oxidase subunit 4